MTDDVEAALPHCQYGFVARDLCLTCTMMDDYETALNIVSEQRNKLIEEAQERERYIERWSAETQTTIANRDAEIEKWRDLQRAVAAMIEADPETWPSHGNAPLAIASALALRKATIDRLRAELAEAQRPWDESDWRPEIVCLCGSTRFADKFNEENLRLTLAGKIVLSIGANVSDASLGIAQDSDTKRRLDELHLAKIDLADRVHVLNVGGYIGDSTMREIEHARRHRKRVTYLESLKPDSRAVLEGWPREQPDD